MLAGLVPRARFREQGWGRAWSLDPGSQPGEVNGSPRSAGGKGWWGERRGCAARGVSLWGRSGMATPGHPGSALPLALALAGGGVSLLCQLRNPQIRCEPENGPVLREPGMERDVPLLSALLVHGAVGLGGAQVLPALGPPPGMVQISLGMSILHSTPHIPSLLPIPPPFRRPWVLAGSPVAPLEYEPCCFGRGPCPLLRRQPGQHPDCPEDAAGRALALAARRPLCTPAPGRAAVGAQLPAAG